MYIRFCFVTIFISFLLCALAADSEKRFEIDPNGYIIFCLCMGRLGNQMEHFLGGLAFAKSINRTLILPPFRTYKNVEYDEWFDYDSIAQYHRVILAKDFMEHVAPSVWPPEKRFGFCYVLPGDQKGCEMKIGNPFTNFWDELQVDFTQTIPYSVSYHTPHLWNKEFPASKYPVLALKGAPAAFPMFSAHLELQKYIKFSQPLLNEAQSLLDKHFNGSRDYVGVHLRNGGDWINTCKHVDSTSKLMSSYQCIGFNNIKKLTLEMCYPSKELVIETTKRIMTKESIQYLFVATDKDPMIKEFQQAMPNVKIVHLDPWLPLMDVILLSQSKHFIGNCVSSFTSFVWRQRLYHDLGSSSHFGNHPDLS